MVCIVFPFIWPSDTEAKGAHTKWRKWGVPASPPRRDCDEPPGCAAGRKPHRSAAKLSNQI